MQMRTTFSISVVVVLLVVSLNAQAQQAGSERQDTPVEAFKVLELPLDLSHVVLTETKKGYALKATLSNNSDEQILGITYLLVLVDSTNRIYPALKISETCKLSGYETRSVTFHTPLKLKLERGVRLELMLEQVIGAESIWEVLKARQALEAYAVGDYSNMPNVLRIPNHVDAPLRQVIP